MNRRPHFSLSLDPSVENSFRFKGASTRYLSPLGLSLKSPIPEYFSSDKTRLTKTQEKQMFEAMKFLQYWISKVTDPDKLTKLIEFRDAIRNRVVCANLGLIHTCIHLTSVHCDNDVLLSAGHMALIEAAVNYSPYKGTQFSTYAMVSIFRRFTREIKRKQLPIHDDADPAALTDDRESPAEREERTFMLAKLQKAMKDISKDDIDILTLRFNLGNKNSRRLTLQEVADTRGRSKERIRQLQRDAISKLREVFETKP